MIFMKQNTQDSILFSIQSMKFLVLCVMVVAALSIQFSVSVPGDRVRCFYEHLAHAAKYSVEVTPMDLSDYEFFIQMVESEEFIYTKTSQHNMEPIIVSKFAPQANYYGFCIKNIASKPMNAIFKLESGIELMELSLLPSHSDNQYLNNEIEYLQKQKQDLYHILENLQGSKQYTETLTNMMGTKAMWFAFIGLGAIILVNLGFYKQVRNTLKQRKLI